MNIRQSSNKRNNLKKNVVPRIAKAVTLYDYIASCNPEKTYELISQYGTYPKPQTPEELAAYVKDYVRKNGQEAIKQIALIHPDRELIIDSHECDECTFKENERKILKDKLDEAISELRDEKQKKEYNNFYSNLTGNTPNQQTVRVPSAEANTVYTNTHLFVMTAFILLGVAYIVKSK